MAELRAIATDLGYTEVATYIQSGNLVLSADATAATVARTLAEAIPSRAGIEPAVMVRTRAELSAVVEGNPFVSRGEDPSHLHVLFTDGDATGALTALDLPACAPEEVIAADRALYLLLPTGVGRSRLAIDLGRTKTLVGTTRNWRTVTTLAHMAEAVRS